MKSDPLKNLRIASPCPMSWEQMTGDERARFCSLCNLHVYNIAELTRKQAAELITKTEGRICGRIYRRTDGSVITKDCPVGLRAIRRRVARVAGAVFATLVALSASVFGQKASKNDEGCKQQVTISRKDSDAEACEITGTVIDSSGAFVANARIRITERDSKTSVETTSNDEGVFHLAAAKAGIHDIEVEAAGFKKLAFNLTVKPKETITATMILAPPAVSQQVLVGVISVEPMVDTTKPGGTFIITGDMIRRLPLP